MPENKPPVISPTKPLASVIEASITVSAKTANPVDLICQETGISKSAIKRAMQAGAVWRQQGKSSKRLRRAKRDVNQGDIISIHYDESILKLTPPEPSLVADEGDYSVWYKPPGLMSSGTKFGDHCAINRWIEQNHQPQRSVFVVHRLDRFAAGLMALAYTKQAAAALSKQFQDRTVSKRYKVIVHGKLETEQTIDTPLEGKASISIIKPLAFSDAEGEDRVKTLVEVDIKTGRKHQIRKHLASIGYPVVGDRQYGSDNKNDLQLVAFELQLDHPATNARKTYTLSPALQPSLN